MINKLRILLISGILSCSVTMHSQIILNTPVTNSQTVQDPNNIRMVPGFHVSSASGIQFEAKIGAGLPPNTYCGEYGKIVISEIHFDTHYSEKIDTEFHHFGEFIELYNSSDVPIDLNGWVIKDNHTQFELQTNSVNPDLVIQPGGFKIITYDGFYYFGRLIAPGQSLMQGSPSAIGGRKKFIELFPELAALPNFKESDIILQNKMVLFNALDKFSLYDSNENLMDQVMYDNSVNGVFVGKDDASYASISTTILDNNDGGIFNGPIGWVYVRDQNGNIVYDGDTPRREQRDEFKQAIYRSSPNSFYTNNALVFAVATATPGSIPQFNVPSRHLDPSINFTGSHPNKDNAVEAIAYDLKTESIVGHSKTYFDDLGNPRVSVSKDFQTNTIWGSEMVYDNFGRQWKQSFPVPTSCMQFENANYLTNPSYKADVLDRYYSDNNPYEAFQATAEQPYSEINYDNNLNPGNVISATGGNKIDNEWKTGYSYAVSAGQEMYYAFGYNHFDGVISSGKETVSGKFFKAVSIDANGVESVSFTDGEGKLLAAARSGGPVNYPVYSLIGTQGYVDVYIPAGTPDGILLGPTLDNYKVFDLKTGQPVLLSQLSLPSGKAYRIEATTIPSSDPNVYVGQTPAGGAITYDTGALGISYSVNYHEYMVNVYNKTGQLVKSVQPQGYAFNSVIKDIPAHMQTNAVNYISKYVYNDQGQIKEATSPDEGVVRFAYRKDGTARFTQNALQTNQLSYVNYDSIGRPVENGVLTGNPTIWNDVSGNPNDPLPGSPTYSRSEQTFSVYDYLDNYDTSIAAGDKIPSNLQLATLMGASYVQENLEGGVAFTYKKTGTVFNAITWYNYDTYGRVVWSVQYIDGLGAKSTHYEYDYKGNVSKVLFQKDSPSELFVHRYTYDLNGVITKAETSVDNVNFITHADYSYYLSGELKRLNIGQGLQGLDYVYTLGGQLKSINHPSLDPTKDPGHDANDVFGVILDYHNGDYKRANTNIASSPSIIGTNQDFNGNIKAVRWANKNDIVSGVASQRAYMYNYNKDGWLTDATFGATNNTGTITTSGLFKEGSLTYDANGNIKSLQRTNNTGQTIDNLTYNYVNSNRLNFVDDSVNPGVSYDIDDQSSGNYSYDPAGRITANTAENLQYFYNTQGLTTEVQKATKTIVKFFYNERGQRIKKESYNTSGVHQFTEFYVIDDAGNVMSTYYKPVSGSIVQKELPIYGSKRLGIYNKTISPGIDFMRYEITDHLGNVRAIVKKVVNNPIVDYYYSDYYPFGEKLPSRNNITGEYRYAYQGQEYDTETDMEAFQLRLWDGRIGRWLSPDPKGQFVSPYLGMGNNPIGLIDPDGGSVAYPPFAGSENGQSWIDADGSWKWNASTGFWDGQGDTVDFLPLSINVSNVPLPVIQMPTQHCSFGFNWTYLSQSDKIGDQFINSTGNSIYMAVQYFQGKGGTGDDAFRNLDGSSMSMDDKVMNMTAYSGNLIGHEMALGRAEIKAAQLAAKASDDGVSLAVTGVGGSDISLAKGYVASYRSLAPGYDDFVMHGEDFQKLNFYQFNTLLNKKGVTGNVRLWICRAGLNLNKEPVESNLRALQLLAKKRNAKILYSNAKITVRNIGYSFDDGSTMFELVTP